jgi:hypothetical protein
VGGAGGRRSALPLAMVAAFLVVAELAVRVVAPSLPEPLRWGAPEDQVKYEQINRLQAEGVRGGVVFTGTSLVDVGVDPARFAALDGLHVPAYNAALAGGDLASVSWWTTHVVIPKLHPRVLVVGLSSRELNPNDPSAAQLAQQFFAGAEVRHIDGHETVLQRLERYGDDVSYLFRYRTDFRTPSNLWGTPEDQVSVYRRSTSPSGWNTTFALGPYAGGPAADRFLATTVLYHDQLGAGELAQLRDLLVTAGRQGIQVVLADMPVTQEYIDLHPHQDADYARYRAAVQGVAATTGVQFVPGGTWATTLFHDPIHLNAAGARQYTALLARTLKPSLPPGV